MVRARRMAVVIVLLAAALPLTALPQLAVLNITLSPGIDPTVVGVITGKIEEPIVESGFYDVLDRSNVDKVLGGKEFQLSSGLVKPEEVRQAGEYLGADLVVAGTVSRVGQTYALSAKMIDVGTGKVVAQASAEQEGKIDVLLTLTRRVGEQLAARGAGGGAMAGATRERTVGEPPPAPDASPFYRHAVLLQGGITEVDDFMLGAAYLYSLRPRVGLTASAAYGLLGYGSFAVNAGAFFTPFPQLSVGLSGGYARFFVEDEMTTDYTPGSFFSVGPVLLVRVWRLAVGGDFKLVVPGGGFCVVAGVGFLFWPACAGAAGGLRSIQL